MGIDLTQWRIQISYYWKFVGRRRHRRGKFQGEKTASATNCNPLLALLLSFCLITAPSLLLQAGDVERNPGPPKLQNTTAQPSPDLRTLSNELTTVSNWHTLGLNLGLRVDQLMAIQMSNPTCGVDRWKSEMLDKWLRSHPNASWKKVASALQNMEEHAVASRIMQRYIQVQETVAEPAVIPDDFSKTNLSIIQGKFAKLLLSVCKRSQEDPKLNKSDFLLFLSSILPLEVVECLPQSADLKDIFQAITLNKLWTFLEYYLLEQTIAQFWESDQELKSRMEQYKKDLSGYKTAIKVKDHIAAALQLDAETSSDSDSFDPKYFKKLSVKLDKPFGDYTLDYLRTLWTSLQTILRLPPLTLLLNNIHEGCICVTWLIPIHLAPQTAERARQSVKFFEGYPILRVIIDDELVYEVKPILREMVQTTFQPPHLKHSPYILHLHFACEFGRLDTIKFLIEQGIDPESKDHNGYTPLHIACKHGHLDVVKFLVVEQYCDHLQPATKKSVTPLDLANSHGHVHVSSFLTAQEISLQPHYVYLCRLSFPPAFKVFVMGNPGVGKSTLVKAIQNRLTRNWFGQFIDRFRRVSHGVELHTTGIVPISIDSKRLGHIIMYDLAGQHEYYSSHAALLMKLVAYPGSLLIVVVDLSKEKSIIIQQLQYWNSFIESHCSQSGRKPGVVIVGSHEDVVKSQLENPKEKSTDIWETLPTSYSRLHVPHEIISLNCTQLASDGLNEVCTVIDNYCNQFQQKVSIDLHLNFLHAFLCQEFEGATACKVSEIVSQISMEEWDAETVSQYLNTLSDRSQFLYLRSDQDVNDGWVILDQGVLFSEVSGTFFAEYHNISSSTGVVPLSNIMNTFPKYDPEMIVSFMSHLEFCHEVADSETALIHGYQLGDSQQQFEKLYFFPALVSVDRPEESCRFIELAHYKCGWSLQCIRPDQFLSPQFLHVLLLRLAFSSFVLAPDPAQEDKACPVLRRQCNMWKAGIHWMTRDGVETIVKVVEQNTVVTVMMGCLQGREMACVRLRSELIRTILEVKERLCTAVEMKESLIHPAELSYPLKKFSLLSSFTITELATAIAEDKQFVMSRQGMSILDISELLYFEPYACFDSKLLSQLFNDENSTKEVPDVFYNDAGKVAHKKIEFLTQALEINKSEYEVAIKTAPESYRGSMMHHCYLLFRTWAHFSPNHTYQALRSTLDMLSVFCGRNPLVLAGLIQSSVGTADINKDEPLLTYDYDYKDEIGTLPHQIKHKPTMESHDQQETTEDFSTIPHLIERKPKPTMESHDQQETTEDFSTIPHLTDKPRLQELQCLQGQRGRRVRVIEGVGAYWKELAIALHFESSVIEHVRQDTFHQTENACQNILRMWLNRQEGTRQPVNWATLMDCLIEAGFVDLATDLKEAVEDYPIDIIT